MSKAIPFSDPEKQFVVANYHRMSIKEMASKMERSEGGVKKLSLDLGLRRGNRFVWTAERTEILKRRYADTKAEVIAKEIGCDLVVVYRKARQLNLKKSEQFLNSPASGRLTSGHVSGMNSRFKKGMPTWNKGKKIGSFGRASETQFKKGHQPHNKQSVGTILRVSQTPYFKIKIAEPDRWEFLHRHNWEKTHGAIPEGFVVWFRDANPENCAVENLECISRQELRGRITIDYDRRKPAAPRRSTKRAIRKSVEPLNEYYPFKVRTHENGADLLDRILKIVPKYLTDSLRADVCQELALRVCAGEIEEIRLPEIVPAVIKMQKKFLPSFFTVPLDGLENWQRDKLEDRFIKTNSSLSD